MLDYADKMHARYFGFRKRSVLLSWQYDALV